jgi:hypothetical protein
MRVEVTGGWEKLHIEELHDLCCSPNIMKVTRSGRMRWVEHSNRVGEMRNVYKILAGKPEGDRVQMDMRSGGSSVKLSEAKEVKDNAGVTGWRRKNKNRSLQRRMIFV